MKACLLTIGLFACAAGEKLVLLSGLPGRAAQFGGEIPRYDTFNIMLPPPPAPVEREPEMPEAATNSTGNSTKATKATPGPPSIPWASLSLCTYPESLRNLSEDAILARRNLYDAPIGLLASRGNCSADQQTRMAIRLANQFFSNIKYLVIHGGQEDGDALKVLYPDRYPPAAFLDQMRVIYVNYRTAAYFHNLINESGVNYGQSPFFLDDPTNRNWLKIVALKPYYSANDWRSGGGGGGSDTFYWFRILLFTVLILTPLCRAGYLWWSGGGRLHWRRNERGWIIGIQYIP